MSDCLFLAARAARRPIAASPYARFWLAGLVAGVLALNASDVRAWTMNYDGFAYEPPSNDTTGYKLPQGGSAPTEYPYHLGDTRYYDNVNTPRPLAAQYIYPPSGWISSNSSSGQGYWPFISPGVAGDAAGGFTYPGLPAPTGHVVVCFGSASNDGKCSRVSPISLGQNPPTGPFRTIIGGTVYYSMLLKVIEAPAAASLKIGFFHAGFNDEFPNGALPTATTPTPSLSLAGARLYLRAGLTTNSFQIGIGSNTDPQTNPTTTWDANNTYSSGNLMTPVLVVGCYEFKDGSNTDDVSSLWVNPDSSTLGAASAPTYSTNGTTFPLTSTGGDIQNHLIRSFFIREGGNPSGTSTYGVQRVVFDELRIGTTWADVTSDVPCTPPTVTAISVPSALNGTALAGVTITGTNFVANVTDVRLKMTGFPDIVGTNVSVSSPTTLTCDFNIPASAAAGIRDVVATTCTDSPGKLLGGFEVTCNMPTVSSISTPVGFVGDTLTGVTISGTNFVTGSTSVKLTMAGQPDIVGTSVSVANSSTLTCTLALPAGAVLGLRDLVVTTCGVATLTNGFDLRKCNDPRFDNDADGDVDMNDFAFFQSCYTGPTGPYASQCRCMIANTDNKIDGLDFAAFVTCATRAGVPANPACDDGLP